MSIWQNSKAVLLRRKAFEHDFCGTGAVISIRGEQSRRMVDDALKIIYQPDLTAHCAMIGKGFSPLLFSNDKAGVDTKMLVFCSRQA